MPSDTVCVHAHGQAGVKLVQPDQNGRIVAEEIEIAFGAVVSKLVVTNVDQKTIDISKRDGFFNPPSVGWHSLVKIVAVLGDRLQSKYIEQVSNVAPVQQSLAKSVQKAPKTVPDPPKVQKEKDPVIPTNGSRQSTTNTIKQPMPVAIYADSSTAPKLLQPRKSKRIAVKNVIKAFGNEKVELTAIDGNGRQIPIVKLNDVFHPPSLGWHAMAKIVAVFGDRLESNQPKSANVAPVQKEISPKSASKAPKVNEPLKPKTVPDPPEVQKEKNQSQKPTVPTSETSQSNAKNAKKRQPVAIYADFNPNAVLLQPRNSKKIVVKDVVEAFGNEDVELVAIDGNGQRIPILKSSDLFYPPSNGWYSMTKIVAVLGNQLLPNQVERKSANVQKEISPKIQKATKVEKSLKTKTIPAPNKVQKVKNQANSPKPKVPANKTSQSKAKNVKRRQPVAVYADSSSTAMFLQPCNSKNIAVHDVVETFGNKNVELVAINCNGQRLPILKSDNVFHPPVKGWYSMAKIVAVFGDQQLVESKSDNVAPVQKAKSISVPKTQKARRPPKSKTVPVPPKVQKETNQTSSPKPVVPTDESCQSNATELEKSKLVAIHADSKSKVKYVQPGSNEKIAVKDVIEAFGDKTVKLTAIDGNGRVIPILKSNAFFHPPSVGWHSMTKIVAVLGDPNQQNSTVPPVPKKVRPKKVQEAPKGNATIKLYFPKPPNVQNEKKQTSALKPKATVDACGDGDDDWGVIESESPEICAPVPIYAEFNKDVKFVYARRSGNLAVDDVTEAFHVKDVFLTALDLSANVVSIVKSGGDFYPPPTGWHSMAKVIAVLKEPAAQSTSSANRRQRCYRSKGCQTVEKIQVCQLFWKDKPKKTPNIPQVCIHADYSDDVRFVQPKNNGKIPIVNVDEAFDGKAVALKAIDADGNSVMINKNERLYCPPPTGWDSMAKILAVSEQQTIDVHCFGKVRKVAAPNLSKLKCADLNELLRCTVSLLKLTLLDNSTICIWPRENGYFSKPKNNGIPIIRIDAIFASLEDVCCIKCNYAIKSRCRRLESFGSCRNGRDCSFLHPLCSCDNAACWRDHAPVMKTCFQCSGHAVDDVDDSFMKQGSERRHVDELMEMPSVKMRPRHRAWMKESTALL